MPLVTNALGADTQTDRQTDIYRYADQSNFKKPGARGQRPHAWFKNDTNTQPIGVVALSNKAVYTQHRQIQSVHNSIFQKFTIY